MMEEIRDDEIIAKGIVPNKDPHYLYFLDADGNLRRKKKGNFRKDQRRKNKRTRIFSDLNLTIPKLVLTCFISQKNKKVHKCGTGAMIIVPKWMVGLKGKVIFIPEESLNNVEENTINLF